VGNETSCALSETRVYTVATKHVSRNSCIVLAAILKVLEAAAGMRAKAARGAAFPDCLAGSKACPTCHFCRSAAAGIFLPGDCQVGFVEGVV